MHLTTQVNHTCISALSLLHCKSRPEAQLCSAHLYTSMHVLWKGKDTKAPSGGSGCPPEGTDPTRLEPKMS